MGTVLPVGQPGGSVELRRAVLGDDPVIRAAVAFIVWRSLQICEDFLRALFKLLVSLAWPVVMQEARLEGGGCSKA